MVLDLNHTVGTGGAGSFCSDAFIVMCSTHGSAAVEWQWAPWAKSLMQSGVLRPQLALFSVSDVGNHLLHQIPDKRILGSIVIPEISLVCQLYLKLTFNPFHLLGLPYLIHLLQML